MKRIVLAIRRSVGIREKTCYENFDAYTNFVVRAAIDVELHIPYSCYVSLSLAQQSCVSISQAEFCQHHKPIFRF